MWTPLCTQPAELSPVHVTACVRGRSYLASMLFCLHLLCDTSCLCYCLIQFWIDPVRHAWLPGYRWHTWKWRKKDVASAVVGFRSVLCSLRMRPFPFVSKWTRADDQSHPARIYAACVFMQVLLRIMPPACWCGDYKNPCLVHAGLAEVKVKQSDSQKLWHKCIVNCVHHSVSSSSESIGELFVRWPIFVLHTMCLFTTF